MENIVGKIVIKETLTKIYCALCHKHVATLRLKADQTEGIMEPTKTAYLFCKESTNGQHLVP